jgi:hypothetical protein
MTMAWAVVVLTWESMSAMRQMPSHATERCCTSNYRLSQYG